MSRSRWPRPAQICLPTFVTIAALACACAPAGVQDGGSRPLEVVSLAERPAFPLPAHLESADMASGALGFDEVFAAGRDLFHTAYNGLDGVGMLSLPNGAPVHRFSLIPLGIFPLGPSSQSCGGCHNLPVAAGAGLSQTHILNDPNGDGVGPFNARSTPFVLGNGLLQLLSQEITEELQAIRDAAAEEARSAPGTAVARALESKGISYGEIVATADGAGEVTYDLSGLEGIDPDLVVRPLTWKGTVPTVRLLTMAAAGAGLGMQGEELVWRLPGGDTNPDPDSDGVTRELSVGDVTAMTVYTAAQEAPQELADLAAAGWVAAPSAEQEAAVARGRAAFTQAGCVTCHVPELPLADTVFEEPTARGNGNYLDQFLAGKDPNYDPEHPVRFDLLTQGDAPRVAAAEGGGAVVRPYGDLKRHAMGRWMAEPGGPSASLTPMLSPVQHDGGIVLVAPDVFITAELWGVGNTGPWLHDGRAGTLREAILLHGEDQPVAVGEPGRSEAQESRDAFAALGQGEQDDVVAFLLSLRLFSLGDQP